MRIVRIFCDRCGKEIKGTEEYSGVFGKLIGRDNEPDIEMTLCTKCTAGLKTFMKKGKKHD